MDPIEKLINPKVCRDVVQLLHNRGWSDAKIARSIRKDTAFVRLVADAQEKFSWSHLKSLARERDVSVDVLLFEATEPRAMKSPLREMTRATRALIDGVSVPKRNAPRTTRKRKSTSRAA